MEMNILKYSLIYVNQLKTTLHPLLLNKLNILLHQQARNAFILKRRYKPPLHKKNCLPRKLTHKYFIYDYVENTECKKRAPVDLILTKNVDAFGFKGDRISVRPYLAYNTLLLPGLAVYATPENIEKYYKEQMLKEKQYSSPYVQQTLLTLSTLNLSIIMSLDVPWTLEKWHVRTNFRKAGYYVADEAITMPEKTISGPNMSYEGKQFYVTIVVNDNEQIKVKCSLYHWTLNEMKKLELNEKCGELSAEPLFPEDKPILDSLPLCNENFKKI